MKGSGWQKIAYVLQSNFSEDDRPRIVQAFQPRGADFPPMPSQDSRNGKGHRKTWGPTRKNNINLGSWPLAVCVERIDESLEWSVVATKIQDILLIKEKPKILPLAEKRSVSGEFVGRGMLA